MSALTIKIVETSRAAKSEPVTGNVPTDGGEIFFFAKFPAMAMIGICMKNRPSSWAIPVLTLYQTVLAFRPANADPLLPTEET